MATVLASFAKGMKKTKKCYYFTVDERRVDYMEPYKAKTMPLDYK